MRPPRADALHPARLQRTYAPRVWKPLPARPAFKAVHFLVLIGLLLSSMPVPLALGQGTGPQPIPTLAGASPAASPAESPAAAADDDPLNVIVATTTLFVLGGRVLTQESADTGWFLAPSG